MALSPIKRWQRGTPEKRKYVQASVRYAKSMSLQMCTEITRFVRLAANVQSASNGSFNTHGPSVSRKGNFS